MLHVNWLVLAHNLVEGLHVNYRVSDGFIISYIVYKVPLSFLLKLGRSPLKLARLKLAVIY